MLFRTKSSQHRYCYLLAQCYIPIIIFILLFNLNFVLPLIVYISCNHFARGTYLSDNEVVGVEELGYELERLGRSVDKEKKGERVEFRSYKSYCWNLDFMYLKGGNMPTFGSFILYWKAMLDSLNRPYLHKEDLQAIF